MGPKAASKGAKKAASKAKAARSGTKKRHKRRRESYSIYIYKVLKQVHPRHWHQQQGHEHHELFRQRHLRENRRRVFSSGSLQPQVYHHQPRNPDCCAPAAARWAGQARRQRGNQGCDQVHQLEVTGLPSTLTLQTALFRATISSRKEQDTNSGFPRSWKLEKNCRRKKSKSVLEFCFSDFCGNPETATEREHCQYIVPTWEVFSDQLLLACRVAVWVKIRGLWSTYASVLSLFFF